MKLRSNLLLTDFGREELIRGNLVISDGFLSSILLNRTW